MMAPSTKNNTKIVIRKFTMNDYDTVIRLWNDADLACKCDGRDSRTDIQRQLKHPCTLYIVAEINGVIVGTAFGTHDARKGWINRLAVLPAYQKQGIAALLIAELEEYFSKLGIDIIACLIEEWNTNSMQVFEHLGYEKYPDVLYFTKRKNINI
jgi:N-acetylglutamate synthase